MVDFYASERQFVDHLAPIWNALDESLRGYFFTNQRKQAFQRAIELGVGPTLVSRPPTGGQIVVASYTDELDCTGREVCLVEHGAGQHYGIHLAGHRPNDLRDAVTLRLCPNQRLASMDANVFAKAETVVVGCPKLDEWHTATREPNEPPVVAFAWHWDRKSTWDEARSAWLHYRPGFPQIVKDLRNAGRDVIGHAHPRMFRAMEREYRFAEVPVVRHFSDVLERADVLVCDNSSVMFEFASVGRPVVVLNAPWYRRHVEHGLRFWSHAGIGPNVSAARDVPAAVENVLTHREHWFEKSEALIADVYANRDGTASRAAADAIQEWASGPCKAM